VWLKLLSVFGLGMVGLWEGVPAGFALGMPALLVGLCAGAGSTTATLLVTVLGERVRARLLRRRGAEQGPPRERLIDRVWRRYGIIGLGLVAPGLTGAPLGVALGLFLRARVRPLVVSMLVGIALWTVTLTLLGALGTAGIKRLVGG
jgi:hypothetical protein